MGTTVERHTHPHLDEGVSHFWENHHRVNIEYAKYVGFTLIAIGVVGIPYAGQQFLIFVLIPLQKVGHLITGLFCCLIVLMHDWLIKWLGLFA